MQRHHLTSYFSHLWPSVWYLGNTGKFTFLTAFLELHFPITSNLEVFWTERSFLNTKFFYAGKSPTELQNQIRHCSKLSIFHINFPHLLGALLPYLLVPPITQSIGIGSTEVTSSEDKGWKLELQEHFASSLLKINLVQCVLVGWCDTEAIL